MFDVGTVLFQCLKLFCSTARAIRGFGTIGTVGTVFLQNCVQKKCNAKKKKTLRHFVRVGVESFFCLLFFCNQYITVPTVPTVTITYHSWLTDWNSIGTVAYFGIVTFSLASNNAAAVAWSRIFLKMPLLRLVSKPMSVK